MTHKLSDCPHWDLRQFAIESAIIDRIGIFICRLSSVVILSNDTVNKNSLVVFSNVVALI